MRWFTVSLRLAFAAVTLIVLNAVFVSPAKGNELIVNGGFETGNFSGWTVVNQAGGSGNFFVLSGTVMPLSGATSVGPASGTFYAVSDQTGPGTHSLLQTFVVAPGSSVILSFDLFANNYAGTTIVNPIGLDYTDGPNQHARVDILTAGASAFDTGAGVLQNLYLGSDAGTNPHGYTHYVFSLTSLLGAGGTFQIRFAESDNQLFYNLGVDNVSITATTAATVPEPTTMLLFGTGLVGIAARVRKRRKAV